MPPRQDVPKRWKAAGKFRNVISSPVKAVVLVLVLGLAGYIGVRFSSAATEDTVTPPTNDLVLATEEAKEQISVQYKPGTDPVQLKLLFDEVGATEDDEIDNLRIKVLKVKPSEREAIVQKLLADRRFEFVQADTVLESNFVKPNDTLYPKQWVWPKTMTDVAWDATTGNPITVATIDSGVNFNHPDLVGKTVPGFDFVNNDNDPTDDRGHGTMVNSVIAAATNNGAGIASACWSCKVMPLKASDSLGKTTNSNLAKAVQYAADHGVKIINISNGAAGVAADPTQKAGIDYAVSKGAIVFASAGNNGIEQVQVPAVFDNVIAVAATGTDDTLASFSTYGSHVDIAAPGEYELADYANNGYRTELGTSFSTPAVSAIAALLWSKYPNSTAAQIRSALLTTADACCDGKISGGRVNAARALSYLANNGSADKTNPTLTISQPAQSATISGSFDIRGSTADTSGISKLILNIDGRDVLSSNKPSSVNISWRTTDFSNGSHTVAMRAIDGAGNTSPIVSRTVTINNDGSNPTPTPPTPTPPTPNPDPTGKVGDLNKDGQVNVTDLSLMLGAWNKTSATADLNKNGKVDVTDLSLLLGNWNK